MSLIDVGQKNFMNTYKQFGIVIESGKDCTVYDAEGNAYLDFVAGIAVNSLGYSNDHLKNALKDQIEQLLHCSNLYWNEKAIKAAEKLVQLSGLDKVFFANSGAEANEGALKLARKYAKKYVSDERYEIISMKESFHGRTFATITATGQEKYQKDLNPLFPGIKYASYNDLQSVKALINDKTCAIIVEPLQGEGGIKPAEKSFLEGLRKICTSEKITLIFDEVQTGIGRSGEVFAYQHYGVTPDIVCLAKGLGGGVPVGAVIAKEEIAKGFEPGDHASTFGGNLLATTAVNVVLEEIENLDLLNHVKETGAYLTEQLNELMKKYPNVIAEVRGFGLIQGIEVKVSPIKIVNKAMDKGLLLIGAGSNVIRFVPPLVITKEELDKGLAILEDCLQSL